MNSNIRKEILSNHLSFWLKWNDETIIQRIKNSKKRPIVLNSSSHELSKLIKKRSNIYSKALYKMNCDNLNKSEVANKIINIYENTKTNN